MNHACVEIHRTVQQKYNQFCVIFFFFCKSNISCVLEFPFPIPRALPLTSCNIGSFRQYSIKLYFQPSFAFKKKKIQKTKEKSFLWPYILWLKAYLTIPLPGKVSRITILTAAQMILSLLKTLYGFPLLLGSRLKFLYVAYRALASAYLFGFISFPQVQ